MLNKVYLFILKFICNNGIILDKNGIKESALRDINKYEYLLNKLVFISLRYLCFLKIHNIPTCITIYPNYGIMLYNRGNALQKPKLVLQ